MTPRASLLTAVAVAAYAAPTGAQQSIQLSDVAGVWHVQTLIGPKDSVVATLDLSQTSNDQGWMMTFPDRAPIPVRVVTVGGDSVVWEAGPYASARRIGQTVVLRTVGHYKGNEMWGTFAADYSVSGKTTGKIAAKRQQRPPNDMFAKWSPDGSRIAFTSDRDGDPEIYVMSADGSNPVRLTFTPGRDAHPTWSPDGNRIAFQSPRGGDDTHLYVMNANGSDQRRLTALPGFSGVPAWSPDGKSILFQRMEPKNATDDKWHIYLMNADGTDLRRLPSGAYNDQVPNWSPDGRRVVFFSDRSGKNQIYMMNPDGTDQRRMTNDAANDDTPSWSPDGTTILFSSDRSGRRAIYRMNADGSDTKAVIDLPGYQPLFSPDQSNIMFHAEVGGRTSLYVVRPDGTGLTAPDRQEARAAVDTPRTAYVDARGTRVALIWIPPGTFTMGTNEVIRADDGWRPCPTCAPRNDAERPAHLVTISKGFWMGRFPVTQGQWRAVMGNNPARYQSAGLDAPVERVTFRDVQEFLQRLNSTQGRWFVRLPTEAEWEYAARGGTTSETYGRLDDIAWYGGNGARTTHPIGQKRPNAFGLYDMLGNVWQWCQDWFEPYPSTPTVDPQGPPAGERRVTRGGCFYCDAIHERAARRNRDLEDHSSPSIGFRIVAAPAAQ